MPYGAMRRTCSSASFGGSTVGDFPSMSRQGSFVDLPMVAIPGLATRVSIRGTTSASQDDLPGLFSAQPDEEVDFDEMAFEGGWTRALFLSAAAALLSALQFGYNNANMNTPSAVMRAALSVPERTPESCNPSLPLPGNDSIWGFCVSVFCLSALIGAAEGGRLADRWGRRVFLLLNSFIYVIAGLLEAASSLPSCESADPCHPEPCMSGLSILMAGRVVTGIACGASTVVVPMYLGEIAPPHLRGQLGSAFLLSAVTAMLLAQVLGLPNVFGTTQGWPWLLGGVALPAALQLLLQPFLLESPRWLLSCGAYGKAQLNLAVLRGCEPENEDLAEELASMLPEGIEAPRGKGPGGFGSRLLLEQEDTQEYTVRDLLSDRQVRWPLTVCVTLMALQQLSGINNAFNYSSTFLARNGLEPEVITLISVSMNVGNVLIVLVSSFFMDRLGRRPLLLMSVGGMGCACLLLTVALVLGSNALVCVAVVLFVMTFGLGLGPVTWLLPAELFPMRKRAAATGLATAVNWLANFAMGQVFLPCLATPLGSYAFVPFSLVLAGGLVFVHRCVPETRGKTLEQIERELDLLALSKSSAKLKPRYPTPLQRN